MIDPITATTFIIGALAAAIPIVITYSKKAAIALAYIQAVTEILNIYMKGNLDHVWTDAEKLDLADKVIALGYKIENDIKIDAGIT